MERQDCPRSRLTRGRQSTPTKTWLEIVGVNHARAAAPDSVSHFTWIEPAAREPQRRRSAGNLATVALQHLNGLIEILGNEPF